MIKKKTGIVVSAHIVIPCSWNSFFSLRFEHVGSCVRSAVSHNYSTQKVDVSILNGPMAGH